MFQNRNYITAIEIGTSKICVLIGESDRDGNLSVKGHGERVSYGAVSKGEITDFNTVIELLSAAIDEADGLAGHNVIDPDRVFVAVTGSDIGSFQGVGNVFISSEDRRVTEDDVNEAVRNAQVKPLPRGHISINSFDSYYQIDGVRRIKNPIDQVADKLEAYIHVVHGDENRIENFLSAMRDVSFDENVIPVFSAVASAFGTLTEDEKENGVLLVEMGAGTTEFLAIYNFGMLLSGVLPVGLEHVANDLAVGLDLHISQARRILNEGEYYRCKKAGKPILEVKSQTGGIRRIPVNSIEKIIDLRLREVFQIICARVRKEDILINTGGVLSGGAAMLPQALDVFKNVFEIPVRSGHPLDLTGASTDLDSPRYNTIWGLLRYGDYLIRAEDSRTRKGRWERILDSCDNVLKPVFRNIGDLKNAIKF